MSEGVVLVYYGEGRGKSTAALGYAIHQAGKGKEATVIQFLKGKDEVTQNFLARLEPEIKYFNFAKSIVCFNDLDEDRRQEEIMNLKNGFNYGKKVITTGACDLVVLDELLGLIDNKFVTIDEVKEMLKAKPEDMTVIITGRVMDERLNDVVDEIYNIASEK